MEDNNPLYFCCKFIEDFATQNNLNIKVNTEHNEIILPFVDKSENTIYLSARCCALILLDALGEDQNYIELLLAIHMSLNDQYQLCHELINELSSDYKLNITPDIHDKVLTQMFVISMHELAHCIFATSPEYKKAYYRITEEILSDEYLISKDELDSNILKDFVTNTISDADLSNKIEDILENHDAFTNESITEAIVQSAHNTSQRYAKKEEYAADIFALSVFFETFSKLKIIDKENIQSFFTYAAETFYFIVNYNSIEDKIDLGHNTRDISLRPGPSFDTIRWQIALQVIYQFSDDFIIDDDYLKGFFYSNTTKTFNLIMKLADKKYDKYLDITSRGALVKRDEIRFIQSCQEIFSVVNKYISQMC